MYLKFTQIRKVFSLQSSGRFCVWFISSLHSYFKYAVELEKKVYFCFVFVFKVQKFNYCIFPRTKLIPAEFWNTRILKPGTANLSSWMNFVKCHKLNLFQRTCRFTVSDQTALRVLHTNLGNFPKWSLLISYFWTIQCWI